MPATNYQRKARNTSVPNVGTKVKRPDIYVCSRCKSLFNKANHLKEFLTVKSNLYEANDSKIHICNDCIDYLYNFYRNTFHDDKSAIRRICMKIDAYYNDKKADEVLTTEPTTSVMRAYMTKINTSVDKMKTYDTTIEEEKGNYLYGDYVYEFEDEAGNIINPKDEYAKFLLEKEAFEKRREAEITVDPELEAKFGLGFEPDEFPVMERQYEEFIKDVPDSCVSVLKESVLDLCRFKAMQVRAIRENNGENIKQYSDLFQKTRKYVDDYIKNYLKENKNNDEDITLGTVTDMIEKFCPAEVWRKRDLFDDVDGIKEYFARFIVRPFKNFFTGSREVDKEYQVNGDENE